jgi:hypothetical protein
MIAKGKNITMEVPVNHNAEGMHNLNQRKKKTEMARIPVMRIRKWSLDFVETSRHFNKQCSGSCSKHRLTTKVG